MAFDSNAAETIAPVLAMIGQEGRIDPNWSCNMLEAVGDQILPDFYRHQRSFAGTGAEQVHWGLKLVGNSYASVEDFVHLAHGYAREESLNDALYWIGKALDHDPGNGEFHRFKASILERMEQFEGALLAARRARQLGADPVSINADIDRIDAKLLCQLKEASSSEDTEISLAASMKLLGMGRLTSRELIALIGRVVSVYAKKH
jgi:hypothetical protein